MIRNERHIARQTREKIQRTPNERLKAQRLKKNWTQVYVATMLGTSDVEVSRWETGTAFPTLYFREQLCELFGTTPEALGFISLTAKPVPHEQAKVLWNVPYRRNPFFTGREKVLTRLHTLLHMGKSATLTQVQAISGLGGIGKTQTAIEYSYRHRDDYCAVLWVKADTPEILTSDFAALASILHLPGQCDQDQSRILEAAHELVIDPR